MLPSVVGLLAVALGVMLVYAGVHGVPGVLDVRPPTDVAPTTGNPP